MVTVIPPLTECEAFDQRVAILGPNTNKCMTVQPDGSIDANIQDQHTEPIDALFAQEISPFTLSADAAASGATTLNYTFTATAGHGLIVGSEVLLLNIMTSHALQAVVKVVATNVITIDRPIDEDFPAATTIARIIRTNMNVVGSLASPQIFTIRAGAKKIDITRMLMTMISGVAMDDSRFGGIAALENGITFRIYNSFQKTIFNFKTNQDIKQFCYDLSYSDKAPAGSFGLSSRMSFGGQAKHGVVLRIGTDDVLQWVVQDDLTGLDSIKVAAQGHEVDEAS